MKSGLTQRQAECLQTIRAYQDQHGHAPRFEDLREACGLASKSGVHRIVQQLMERGHVTYIPGHARSLRVVE